MGSLDMGAFADHSPPVVKPEAIPECLRERDQWLNWKYEVRSDSKKATKVPYQPEADEKGRFKNAKTNDQTTWRAFERCHSAVNVFDGVGFAFADGDGLCGVDLDHCFDEQNQLLPWAREIVDQFDGTWIEYSPSGQGLHIWCKGKPVRSGKGTVNKSVELYDAKSPRYFTVTGNTFSGRDILQRQDALDWLHTEFFAHVEAPQEDFTPPAENPTDEDVVRRALEHINGSDYDTWHKVGMALKSGGYDCSLWDWWSQRWEGYKAGVCEKKWKTFKREGYGIGSIIHLAKANGFEMPKRQPLPFEKAQRRPEPKHVPIVAEGDEVAWQEPIRLMDVTDLPVIDPREYLPQVVADMVKEAAKVTQTPVDLAVMIALSVVATCVQGKFKVTPGSGWFEPVHFYAVLGAESGERKSAIFRHLTEPIVTWQEKEVERTLYSRSMQSAARDFAMAKIKAVKDKYRRAESPADVQSLKEEQAKLESEMPPEPVEPILFGGETTGEGLQREFSEHNGSWAILTDEGGIFEVLGGMFTKGKVNLDTFLKAYSGDAINVSRGGRKVRVPHPALTICVMVQPSIIRGFGTKEAFRGTGFLARFLYIQPASMIGKRIANLRDEMNPTIVAAYHRLIIRLLEWRIDEPIKITLTPEALEWFDAFSQWIEDQLKEGARLFDLRDWAGKLAGNALRIASLIHLVDASDFSEPKITETEMRKALGICTSLIEHALYSFSTMAADPAVVDAKYLMEYLVTHKLRQVSEGTLHNLYRFRESKYERLREALTILINKNIVLPMQKKGRGSHGIHYLLNPALLEKGKANELGNVS